jgi:hypothetical protein
MHASFSAKNGSSVDDILSRASKSNGRRKLEFIKPLKSSNNFHCVEFGANEKSKLEKNSSKVPTGSKFVVQVDSEGRGLFPSSLVESNMKWEKIAR